MALQPLDKVIFVVGLLGFLGFSGQLIYTYGNAQRELSAHVQTPRPDAELELTCWTPPEFSAAADRFAQDTCTTKFLNVIQGHANAGESGLRDSSGEVATFEVATVLYEDVPTQSNPAETPETQKELESFWTNLLLVLMVMFMFIWIAFILAIMFGQVGSAHACYLEAAFWRVLMGEASLGSKAGTEPNGGLLDKPSNPVTKRIITLSSTRKLAVGYLALQVLLLLAWCLLGFAIHRGDVAIGAKLDQVSQKKMEFKMMAESVQKKAAMKKEIMAAMAAGLPPPVMDRPLEPLTPEEQEFVSKMTLPPTHDSNNFLCDFDVRNLDSVQSHTVQCMYDVHRQAPARNLPFDPTKMLHFMSTALNSGMIICFGMAVFYLFHALFFFLVAPLSLRRSVLPVLKHLGIRPRGGQFALTDVYFVAAYTMLARKDKFLLSTQVNAAPLEMQQLGKNLDAAKPV